MNENSFLNFLADKNAFTPELREQISLYVSQYNDREEKTDTSHQEASDLLKELNLLAEEELTPADTQENEVTMHMREKLSLPQNAFSPEKEDAAEERYVVIETLGKGGMGIVQRVQDFILGREVALKKIKVKKATTDKLYAEQQMMLWRLAREAAITAILEHPNIVPIYDLQHKENGELYFTMRKVEGLTLSQTLKKIKKEDRFFDENKVLSILLKVCDAVAYAHSRGVIHRDLKPDNIMIGEFGEVYVMDWGIAKQMENKSAKREEPSGNLEKKFEKKGEKENRVDTSFFKIKATTFESFLTKMDNIGKEGEIYKTIGGLGTPGYMPPEQQEDASKVTIQSDIYALGKILKQCFTFLSPLQDFKERIAEDHQKIKGIPNTSVRIPLPTDIQAIVVKATNEDPAERYQQVQEFAADIERYLKNVRVSVRQYSMLEILNKWFQRNKQKVLLYVLFLLCVSLLGAYSQWKREQKIAAEFKNVFKQAEEKTQKFQREMSVLSHGEQIEQLLHILNNVDDALRLQPAYLKVQLLKIALGKRLIRLACESQDYQLALYIAKGLKNLSSFPPSKHQALLFFVTQQQNKTLREHLERFDYWDTRLRKGQMKEGEREKALLEFSQMKEPQILEKLLVVLQEGSLYFAKSSKQRNATLEFYFKTMIEALGKLENPKAGESLLSILRSFAWVEMQSSRDYISIEKLSFMILLAQALGNSKTPNMAQNLDQVRQSLKEKAPQFSKQTSFAYEQLLPLEKDTKLAFTYQDYFYRGLAKASQKKYEEAIEALTKALFFKEETIKIYYVRGTIFLRKGDLRKAIEDFNETIKQDSKYVLAYHARGRVKVMLNDLEGALKDYNKVLKLKPLSETYKERGDLQGQRKQFHLALADYNQALLLDPKSAEAFNSRGATKTQLNQIDEALLDYDKAISLAPKRKEFYLNRGMAKENFGNLKGALNDYIKAIQLDPQFSKAYYYRGIIKYKQGEFDSAINDYNEALRLEPKQAVIYHDRSVIHFRKKEVEASLKDASKAIELDPNLDIAYLRRGLAYKVQGEFEKAMQDFTKTIQLNSKNASAFNSRGMLRAELKQYDEALEDFIIAIQLSPILVKNSTLAFFIQLLNRRIGANLQQNKLIESKKYLLLFQKYAPKSHENYQVVLDLLEKIDAKREKEK